MTDTQYFATAAVQAATAAALKRQAIADQLPAKAKPAHAWRGKGC